MLLRGLTTTGNPGNSRILKKSLPFKKRGTSRFEKPNGPRGTLPRANWLPGESVLNDVVLDGRRVISAPAQFFRTPQCQGEKALVFCFKSQTRKGWLMCTLPETKISAQKWMVEIQLFPFGITAYFQVRTVSFRECTVLFFGGNLDEIPS